MSRLRNFRHNIYYAVLTLLLVFFMQSIRPVMSYPVQVVLPTSPVVTIASTLPKTEVAFTHGCHYLLLSGRFACRAALCSRQRKSRNDSCCVVFRACRNGRRKCHRYQTYGCSEAEYNERGLGMLVTVV